LTKADYHPYQELAVVALPERDEQMAMLLTLPPLGPDGAGRVVELGVPRTQGTASQSSV
jgi:hypothetical protein